MKKIIYFISLLTFLCACNSDIPTDKIQVSENGENQSETTILSFNSSEDFLSTLENFDLSNPTHTRSNPSFISA